MITALVISLCLWVALSAVLAVSSWAASSDSKELERELVEIQESLHEAYEQLNAIEQDIGSERFERITSNVGGKK